MTADVQIPRLALPEWLFKSVWKAWTWLYQSVWKEWAWLFKAVWKGWTWLLKSVWKEWTWLFKSIWKEWAWLFEYVWKEWSWILKSAWKIWPGYSSLGSIGQLMAGGLASSASSRPLLSWPRRHHCFFAWVPAWLGGIWEEDSQA